MRRSTSPRPCHASSASRSSGSRNAPRTWSPPPTVAPRTPTWSWRRRKDGTILGLRAHYVQDCGSYLQLLTPTIAHLTLFMAPGPTTSSRSTSPSPRCSPTPPTDAYRGAGRPEATHAIERMMDILAKEVGVDRVTIRRRNFAKEFPSPARRVSHMTLATTRSRWTSCWSCRMTRPTFEKRRAGGGRPRQAARQRDLDLRRDLRAGAVSRHERDRGHRRRVGELDRARPPHRQGDGDHRHLAAWPGTRDVLVADRRVASWASRSTTSR